MDKMATTGLLGGTGDDELLDGGSGDDVNYGEAGNDTFQQGEDGADVYDRMDDDVVTQNDPQPPVFEMIEYALGDVLEVPNVVGQIGMPIVLTAHALDPDALPESELQPGAGLDYDCFSSYFSCTLEVDDNGYATFQINDDIVDDPLVFGEYQTGAVVITASDGAAPSASQEIDITFIDRDISDYAVAFVEELGNENIVHATSADLAYDQIDVLLRTKDGFGTDDTEARIEFDFGNATLVSWEGFDVEGTYTSTARLSYDYEPIGNDAHPWFPAGHAAKDPTNPRLQTSVKRVSAILLNGNEFERYEAYVYFRNSASYNCPEDTGCVMGTIGTPGHVYEAPVVHNDRHLLLDTEDFVEFNIETVGGTSDYGYWTHDLVIDSLPTRGELKVEYGTNNWVTVGTGTIGNGTTKVRYYPKDARTWSFDTITAHLEENSPFDIPDPTAGVRSNEATIQIYREDPDDPSAFALGGESRLEPDQCSCSCVCGTDVGVMLNNTGDAVIKVNVAGLQVRKTTPALEDDRPVVQVNYNPTSSDFDAVVRNKDTGETYGNENGAYDFSSSSSYDSLLTFFLPRCCNSGRCSNYRRGSVDN